MPLFCEIKVIPSSGKSECKLDKNGTLKCYLKSLPENNKANDELIKLFAKVVGLPKQEVTITFGHTSRNKRIKINADISFEQLLEKMGIERQMQLF